MSIRTRLLLINIVWLAVVFVGISLFAGSQITAGLRVDYEQRLISAIELIAQGIAPSAAQFARDEIDDAAMQAVFAPYQNQLGGTLQLVFTGQPIELYRGTNTARSRIADFRAPEIEAAVAGQPIVSERTVSGEARLITAASVAENGNPIGLVLLSVPTSALQTLIVQRWGILILGMIVLTVIAALCVLAIAQHMLKSLRELHDSAARWANGDLAHRITAPGQDEIGAVARAFNTMATRIQSMLEAQRTFASNTSHEFRTPLTAIQLRTEALKRSPAVTQDTAARQSLDEIDAEIARLTTLIQGLTLLARLDADQLELGRDEVDIVRFASALCQQMRPYAEDKQIVLHLVTPTEPIYVSVNLTHLTLVFRNLLDNAIKYTPSGGSVEWSLAPHGNDIIHTITDTGIGIAPEVQPHVFERFYRADRARMRDVPGSGLGLSIVAAILRAYRGEIQISSPGVNSGTRVTVRWRSCNAACESRR
jgi:signal transduction histidine kinase